MPNARRIGMYKARPVYRVPVKVVQNKPLGRVEDWCNPTTTWLEVISLSAADAANKVMDQLRVVPNIEVFAYGPKGGVVHRYCGWESSVFAQMMAPRPPENLKLEFT